MVVIVQTVRPDRTFSILCPLAVMEEAPNVFLHPRKILESPLGKE